MSDLNHTENNEPNRAESAEQQPAAPDVSPDTPTEEVKSEPAPQAETAPAAEAPAPAPKPIHVRPQEPKLPTPDDDVDLDKEVADALGDNSIMDMYGLSDDQAEAAMSDKKEDDTIPGINRGKVISITDDGLFVDLGGKSQGFLPSEEVEEGETVNVGDSIDVVIIRYDNRDGLLILSRKSAEQQLLRKNLTVGAQVEARVTGTNKGGLELDIKGLKAFMPISQIDIARIEDMEPFVGERFICEVTQVERGDKNIVLSRRNVLAKEELEKSQEIWNELEEGQLRHGTVRSIADYGAFINLGGVDGLLHVSELSWARVKHPKDVLEVGQTVDVLVVEVDREKKRIGLSLRKAGGDPWTTAEQKYVVGSRHQAQVANLMEFGAFAELEPGIEGLIPISEMTWAGRIRHPSDVVQTGQMVEVEILKFDADKRRISMSMKKLQDNPWGDITNKYQPEQICEGTVVRITDFGAFVTLEPGVDGLIHISELSDKHVNQVTEVVKQNEQVKVRVLSVDPGERRIALSMKNLDGTPEDAAAEQMTEAPAEESPKKKKKRPLRGGLTW